MPAWPSGYGAGLLIPFPLWIPRFESWRRRFTKPGFRFESLQKVLLLKGPRIQDSREPVQAFPEKIK